MYDKEDTSLLELINKLETPSGSKAIYNISVYLDFKTYEAWLVCYKKGKENAIANALSRIQHGQYLHLTIYSISVELWEGH